MLTPVSECKTDLACARPLTLARGHEVNFEAPRNDGAGASERGAVFANHAVVHRTELNLGTCE